MPSTTDLPLDAPFPSGAPRREAVVQDRPTLGAMPRTRRGVGWWLLPAVDLASSTIALTVVAILAGSHLLPAMPLTPLLLVLVYGALGVYGAQPSRGLFSEDGGVGWPVIRLLAAALFAWSTSLLIPLSSGAQLALWGGFVLLDAAGRRFGAPLVRRLEPIERWVLVGSEATAERVRNYEPLRAYASVVGTV